MCRGVKTHSNGHVVRRRWNRTTAQQLGEEIEKDTKRVKRVMFDGRVGVAESQRDEHPLVKECAKRASAILFYSTLLFFFIPCSFSFFSSPLYLSIDKVHSFQKRNNGQVRSWNASSLRRRSLLAFDEQVTDWGTGRIYVCQGCIFRLTCSYPELTKDHVLTSAYVKIFRTVTKNVVNSSVYRKKKCSWHPLNKHAMNIFI